MPEIGLIARAGMPNLSHLITEYLPTKYLANLRLWLDWLERHVIFSMFLGNLRAMLRFCPRQN